jgi:hypothetical protein
VVHSREKLGVDRESAVERLPWLGQEAHGKLPLEHDDCAAEEGPVGEQLEDDGGGDLVRDVGDAHVEVRELRLQDVALNNLQDCAR